MSVLGLNPLGVLKTMIAVALHQLVLIQGLTLHHLLIQTLHSIGAALQPGSVVVTLAVGMTVKIAVMVNLIHVSIISAAEFLDEHVLKRGQTLNVVGI